MLLRTTFPFDISFICIRMIVTSAVKVFRDLVSEVRNPIAFSVQVEGLTCMTPLTLSRDYRRPSLISGMPDDVQTTVRRARHGTVDMPERSATVWWNSSPCFCTNHDGLSWRNEETTVSVGNGLLKKDRHHVCSVVIAK
jgi:hypothetical protein